MRNIVIAALLGVLSSPVYAGPVSNCLALAKTHADDMRCFQNNEMGPDTRSLSERFEALEDRAKDKAASDEAEYRRDRTDYLNSLPRGVQYFPRR